GTAPPPREIGVPAGSMAMVKSVPLSTNATCFPSGDTTGLLSAPAPFVICTQSPFRVTDQILYCLSSLRSEEKTIRVESGNHEGSRSSKGPVVNSLKPDTSGATSQT